MIEETAGEHLMILVRRDLPWNVRAVQGAHAVANWTKRCRMTDEQWGRYGPAFVLYSVSGVEELEEWARQLEGSVLFCEPDLGEEATALAWLGNRRLEGLGLA